MDQLKGERGSGRREAERFKPCDCNPANSTSGLILKALHANGRAPMV
jgi:hypothetical protein